MLNPDGSICQDFFKPKQVLVVKEKRWGEAEKELLYAGLEKHGVGKWREIGALCSRMKEDAEIAGAASTSLHKNDNAATGRPTGDIVKNIVPLPFLCVVWLCPTGDL